MAGYAGEDTINPGIELWPSQMPFVRGWGLNCYLVVLGMGSPLLKTTQPEALGSWINRQRLVAARNSRNKNWQTNSVDGQ